MVQLLLEVHNIVRPIVKYIDDKSLFSLVYTYFIATNYSNGVGSQVLATLRKVVRTTLTKILDPLMTKLNWKFYETNQNLLIYTLHNKLAIVLYGWAHPDQISSFTCCHEDTSADHLTRFSILKNTELANEAAVLKWRLILRLAGNVGISDHWGSRSYFQTIVL